MNKTTAIAVITAVASLSGCVSLKLPFYDLEILNPTPDTIYHVAVTWGHYPIAIGGVSPMCHAAYVAINPPIPESATVSWTDAQDNKHSVVITVAPRPSREMNVFMIEIQPDATVKSYWRRLGAGLPKK